MLYSRYPLAISTVTEPPTAYADKRTDHDASQAEVFTLNDGATHTLFNFAPDWVNYEAYIFNIRREQANPIKAVAVAIVEDGGAGRTPELYSNVGFNSLSACDQVTLIFTRAQATGPHNLLVQLINTSGSNTQINVTAQAFGIAAHKHAIAAGTGGSSGSSFKWNEITADQDADANNGYMITNNDETVANSCDYVLEDPPVHADNWTAAGTDVTISADASVVAVGAASLKCVLNGAAITTIATGGSLISDCSTYTTLYAWIKSDVNLGDQAIKIILRDGMTGDLVHWTTPIQAGIWTRIKSVVPADATKTMVGSIILELADPSITAATIYFDDIRLGSLTPNPIALTLPAAPAVGDVVKAISAGGSYTITAPTGAAIEFSTSSSVFVPLNNLRGSVVLGLTRGDYVEMTYNGSETIGGAPLGIWRVTASKGAPSIT